MKVILKRLGLFDSLEIELEIERENLYEILKLNVDEKQPDFFDIFSSSKNEYKGIVSLESFEIKRKRKFFDMNLNFAKAKGQMFRNGTKTLIKTEISSLHGRLIAMFIFLFLFYSVFILVFFISYSKDSETPIFIFPFILLHALFMFGIPYLIVRKSVSRMKHELERDLYFMTKKKNALQQGV